MTIVENYAKTCVDCRKVKILEEFYPCLDTKIGVMDVCITCHKRKNLKSNLEPTELKIKYKNKPTLVKCEVFVPKEELTAFIVQMNKMSKKYIQPAK